MPPAPRCRRADGGRRGPSAGQLPEAGRRQPVPARPTPAPAYLAEGRDRGNTFDIHRLLHFAKTRGKQNELLDLVYTANFAEGRSVFDDERVVELAVQAGLDVTEVRAVPSDETAFAAERFRSSAVCPLRAV